MYHNGKIYYMGCGSRDDTFLNIEPKSDREAKLCKRFYEYYMDVFEKLAPNFWGFTFLEYILGKDHASAIRYYLKNNRSYTGYKENLYMLRAITYYVYLKEHTEEEIEKKSDEELNRELNQIFFENALRSAINSLIESAEEEVKAKDKNLPRLIANRTMYFVNKKKTLKKYIQSLYKRHGLKLADFKRDMQKFSANVYLNAVKYKEVSDSPFGNFLYEQDYFKNINLTFHEFVKYAPEVLDFGYYYWKCEDISEPFKRILVIGYKTLEEQCED